MKCPNCGSWNPEGEKFCGYCGRDVVPQVQQSIAASPPMARRTGMNRTLVMVAIVVVILLIAVVAILIVAFSGSGPHLKITRWTPTNAAMFVIFAVEVSNTGEESGSATIHCTVSFSNGDSYSGTQAINLGPGESSGYAVTVIVPFSHILDTSGEYSCTLS